MLLNVPMASTYNCPERSDGVSVQLFVHADGKMLFSQESQGVKLLLSPAELFMTLIHHHIQSIVFTLIE